MSFKGILLYVLLLMIIYNFEEFLYLYIRARKRGDKQLLIREYFLWCGTFIIVISFVGASIYISFNAFSKEGYSSAASALASAMFIFGGFILLRGLLYSGRVMFSPKKGKGNKIDVIKKDDRLNNQ